MDTHMDRMEKKTTILFPPDLYENLANLAQRRNTSVGELVREACRQQYFLSSRKDRIAAVAELAALSLPVGTVEEMERESVPAAEPLP
ncbi:MAG: CopG family transcriptional regulator [Bryobacteraceae bacterium]